MEGPPGMAPTFRENSLWHGRSPLKNAGPSLKTASGMEGPPEKRRTFRENGSWHGRSPGKAPDLPGKWLLAWKVPLKNAGPSGKTAPIPEGSLDGEVAVHQQCRFGGRRRHEAERGGMRRHATPRLGGACEAMALRRESRRGSPVLPWLAGGVSRCSIRGCPRDGDGCRPSGSGCSSRPCARRNTRSCRRSRAAGPAGTGIRIACWRG